MNVKDIMGLICNKLCHPFITPCKCATFLNKSCGLTKASGNTAVQEDGGLYSSQLELASVKLEEMNAGHQIIHQFEDSYSWTT